MDLHASKWAPKSSNVGQDDSKTRKTVTRINELQRSKRLFKRLQWKSSLLAISYQQAMADISATNDIGPEEAKTMFKVDFFEFYVLLERLLVQLLGVFRVPVSQSGNTAASNSSEASGAKKSANHMIIGSSKGPLLYHRFHAQILESFDQPSNPLHEILGVEPVKTQLQNAKEFRNKWKDAEEFGEPQQKNDPAEEVQASSKNSKYDRRVEELDLINMLRDIGNGLRKAQELAEIHVRESSNSSDVQLLDTRNLPHWLSYESMECDDEEYPFEAMPDAMDWQYG